MRFLFLTSLCFIIFSAGGEEIPAEQALQNFKAPDGQSIPKPALSPNGDVSIGKVLLSRKDKSIHIPAYANLEEGIIEYALCLPNGKIHEALLLTVADPLHISIAMKLAGFQAFEKLFPEFFEQDGEFVEKPFTLPKPADYAPARVRIEVAWKENGKEHRSDLSDILINAKTRQKFPSGGWHYTNSCFFHGRYQASLRGDVIAIFADRGSLINYIGPNNDGDNESGWIVNPARRIPTGTPATLIISPCSSAPPAPSTPSKP